MSYRAVAALLAGSMLAGCAATESRAPELPAPLPPITAPTLDPLPEGLPAAVEVDGGTLLPSPLDAAVWRMLAQAEQLPELAERKLDLQRQRDDGRLRHVVEVMQAHAETEYARGVRDAGGVPVLTVWLLVGGSVLLALLGGVGLGVALAGSPGVVVAR